MSVSSGEDETEKRNKLNQKHFHRALKAMKIIGNFFSEQLKPNSLCQSSFCGKVATKDNSKILNQLSLPDLK